MRTRIWARRPAALAAALALAAILPACGGGSSGGGGGNAPTTLPPAPVRSLVIQGNFQLVSVTEAQDADALADYIRHEFTTSGTGTLEVNADWTFASTQMAIIIGRGSCSFAQIDAALAGNAAACPEAGGALASSRPARVTLNSLPGGTYTLVIVNVSNNAESGNYQVFLTR